MNIRNIALATAASMVMAAGAYEVMWLGLKNGVNQALVPDKTKSVEYSEDLSNIVVTTNDNRQLSAPVTDVDGMPRGSARVCWRWPSTGRALR